MPYISVILLFDEVRDDARFQDILRRMKPPFRLRPGAAPPRVPNRGEGPSVIRVRPELIRRVPGAPIACLMLPLANFR